MKKSNYCAILTHWRSSPLSKVGIHLIPCCRRGLAWLFFSWYRNLSSSVWVYNVTVSPRHLIIIHISRYHIQVVQYTLLRPADSPELSLAGKWLFSLSLCFCWSLAGPPYPRPSRAWWTTLSVCGGSSGTRRLASGVTLCASPQAEDWLCFLFLWGKKWSMLTSSRIHWARDTGTQTSCGASNNFYSSAGTGMGLVSEAIMTELGERLETSHWSRSIQTLCSDWLRSWYYYVSSLMS